MKFIIPIFKVFVAFISLSQVGNALIHNTSFKNISRQFKPEYQHYSPVLGKVALERGLIYNLRFFGNLTEGVKEGRREYVSDKSNDPLMQLLILLFPSSAGNLASSSEGISNFGKYATPEMVATLLNFADSCRRFLPHASELEADIQAINDKKAEAIKSLKRDRRFYTDEKIRNVAEQAFKEKEEISKKYYKIDYDKYKKRFKKLFDPFFYNLSRRGLLLLSENVDNILLLVENSIKNEISVQSKNIYPTYTTEQVILAFFCHKFNTKSDLWVFVSHLNPEFLERTADFGELSTWNLDLLSQASELHSKATQAPNYLPDFDFVFANNFIDNTSPIPYPNNLSPTYHASCPYFDRSQSEGRLLGLDFNNTFSDCAEITMRHFANIILYNKFEDRFALPTLKLEQISLYFQNFAEFYETQKPDMANDGSLEIRGRWNRVVGDLNYRGVPARFEGAMAIRYNKKVKNNKENELDTGYINFMRVWQELLGPAFSIKPYDKSWDENQRKTWLKNSFETLIKTLNPTLTSIVDTSSVSAGADKDLFGTVLFEITNNNEEKFSFELSHNNGSAYLRDISYKSTSSLKINLGNATGIFTLLNSDKNTIPLYNLFANGEYSSDGKKAEQLKKIASVSDSTMPLLINLLKSMDTRDPHTCQTYLNLFDRLLATEIPGALKDLLLSSAKVANSGMISVAIARRIETKDLTDVYIDNPYDATLIVHTLKDAARLEKLELNANISLDTYTVPATLKELTIKGRVRNLDLKDAARLEKLELSAGISLDTYTVPATLKELTIKGVVRHLDLTYATQLKKLDLSEAKELEKIHILPGANISSLRIPSSLKMLNIEGAVEKFHLDSESEQIILSPLARVGTIIVGKNVERLDFTGMSENIDCIDAHKLEYFALNGGSIGTLRAPASLRKLLLNGKVGDLNLNDATRLGEISILDDARVNILETSSEISRLTISGKVKHVNLASSPDVDLRIQNNARIGELKMSYPPTGRGIESDTRNAVSCLYAISGEIGLIDLSALHTTRISFSSEPKISTLIAPPSLQELILKQHIVKLDLSNLGNKAKTVKVYQVSGQDKALNRNMISEYVFDDALGYASAG